MNRNQGRANQQGKQPNQQERETNSGGRKRVVWWLSALLLLVAGVSVTRVWWRQSREDQFRESIKIASENQRWGRVAAVASMWREYLPDDPEANYAAGLAAWMRGDEATAVQMMEAIDEDHPVFAQRCVLLAKIRSSEKHLPAEPIELLQKAIQLDPTVVEPRRLLLRQYGLTLQHDKVASIVDNAIKAEADAPAMYVYLMAPSIVTYSDGESLASSWAAIARHAGNADEARDYEVIAYCHAAQANRLNETELETTREQFDSGGKALDDRLDQLSEKYPTHVELILEQIRRAWVNGDSQAMRRWLSQVPASEFDDPRPWRWKGAMHVMQEEWHEAEVALRATVERNPYDWIALHQLGNVMARQGKTEESQRFLTRGALGNQVRREIVDLSHINQLTPSLLAKMQRYADLAGQPHVAERLAKLLERVSP
ncbi:tetratricopeptide repeat protein [Rhodopirellula halodulae]|uniref:tetratricopeptide repeat protein n=1 Tax=Rhodopirellula halodulae TaxID=2894198 RepID=UPI001E5BEC5D|nr:hypothetical protein [Rhodopirellula sp. JC737]MCC9657305.1 hypothetical protein [Rhodopirellula sp. JC737]